MKKILVIGSINVDIVFYTHKLPEKGETIFSKNFETYFGGKGANQAFTIGRLGGDIELLGVVGNDNYGKDSLHNLKTHGNVRVDRVDVIDHYPTGLANIVVASDGSNQIIVNSGANFQYSPPYIETCKSVINEKDIVIFQLEIPIAVVETLANYAKTKGKIVILNPAPAQVLSSELLSYIDYLIPNETELGVLSGRYVKNVEEALKEAKSFAQQHKIPHIIVTLGKSGSYYVSAEEAHLIQGLSVNAVDTTCAGDSYIGAFTYKLAQGESKHEALNFATRVSAVVVTKNGAQSSVPTLNEVLNFPF